MAGRIDWVARRVKRRVIFAVEWRRRRICQKTKAKRAMMAAATRRREAVSRRKRSGVCFSNKNGSDEARAKRICSVKDRSLWIRNGCAGNWHSGRIDMRYVKQQAKVRAYTIYGSVGE